MNNEFKSKHEAEKAFSKLKEEFENLSRLCELQAAEIELLRMQRFGPKGEHLTADQRGQLQLFGKKLVATSEDGLVSPSSTTSDGTASADFRIPAEQSKPGRRKLPLELPRIKVISQPSEEDLICVCGCKKKFMGSEISEQLEYLPARVYIIENTRQKFACAVCQENVVIGAAAKKPIKKGLPGPSLLARTLVGRYWDCLPAYRQEEMFARLGYPLSRSTICNWSIAAAKLVRPLVDRIAKRVRSGAIIWTDDTPVKIQDRGVIGRCPESRIWTYRGDSANPYVFYEHTRTRRRDGPRQHLENYAGYLVADCFAGYRHIFAGGDVEHAACMAHVRRKFFEAIKSAGYAAIEAVHLIDSLYRIEHQAESIFSEQKIAQEKFFELRLRLRKENSKELLAKFRDWLDLQSCIQLPKSLIGKAISYTLKNWKALTTFLQHGEVTLDNNYAENLLRRVALGRKNWLFFGSERGGQSAARFLTLICSAKRHGLDPEIYLRDVITRLTETPNADLNELLPDCWRPSTGDLFSDLAIDAIKQSLAVAN